ncbi:uncharacterized protein FMAN_01740 [Fusarium mangiferae]|uniref:Uncharacterized protein n=1 Tax=Fusarium mangiferae TaxID=192010 RepID=A0A1L7SK58_FUSMA|nr:uncharacterized protein FMAN_01740 [Fusarium mangiferae]CVK84813.1 uncharacterized protein FMAN_01740 [Fusarium mangiferae]
MPDEYSGFAHWDLENSDSDSFDEDDEPVVLPRCCLCQFKFELLDSIVVFNPQNRYLPPIWEGQYFGNGETVSMENGYHSSCVNQFTVDFSLDDNIGDAICNVTHYRNFGDFVKEPLASFETNRLRRLKEMLAQEFMNIIGGRLPLEVCENIGSHCLRDYATRLFKDAWAKKGHFGARDAAVRVTKSHAIWAQRIEFEGIQYIKSLSTTRRNQSDTKLFEATDGTRVNIYFAEDPLGIREVVMTRDDNTVLAQGENLSWVINRGVALPFWFKLESDGLKLRNLAMTKTKKAVANYQQRRWAVLPQHLGSCQFAPPPGYDNLTEEKPIRAVDWNLPGCRGYSVLMDADCVRDIVPNNGGGSSSRLMDTNINHAGAWVYIPIDPDEQVVELWRRYFEFPSSPNLTMLRSLLIRTNKGRSFFLGSHSASHYTSGRESRLTYHAIAELSPTEPTRMFYGKTENLRFWLGFEQVATRDLNAVISSVKPAMPIACSNADFFTSTANLQNVRTISVCRGWRECLVLSHADPPGEGIAGMLLTYADGRQRSVGQIRLDYMDPPLVVTSGKFWLGSDKSEEERLSGGFWPSRSNINWVEVDTPLEDEKREYFEVPLTGSLEWHSYMAGDYYRHLVIHHESNKLQDKVDEIGEMLAREVESGELGPAVVKAISLEF